MTSSINYIYTPQTLSFFNKVHYSVRATLVIYSVLPNFWNLKGKEKDMGSKICKALVEKSQYSNCLAHQNQVASESVHGAELAAKQLWARCDVCVEQTKDCKCEQNTADQEPSLAVEARHHGDANSNFAHAVINMIGMLIGELYFSALL